MMNRFANVIVDISHEKVDRPFGYKIPPVLQGVLQPGMRVQIPFGKGDRLRTGYVIELLEEAPFPEERMKEIASALTDVSQPQQRLIALAAWMKEQYGSTMIAALRTVLPARQRVAHKEKRRIALGLCGQEAEERLLFYEKKHQTARARLLQELLQEGELPWELVVHKLHVTAQTIRGMQKDGVICLNSERLYRNPVKPAEGGGYRKELSAAQQFIADRILEDFDEGRRKPCLIHGITGSGKTEVYLALIEGMIKRGKQAIVLIPEIALTYQTLLRFYRHFKDRVSVINSTLSQGEKQDQRERANKGEIDVIIGPRSALFTPFPDLGMIIIDEEHENSYKSETMPKYHARETALELARLCGAVVVMGSATPSLESYDRAKKGEFSLYTLQERLAGGQLPQVYVEDLRRELREGNRTIFSKRLQEKLGERLERGEQAMLFLNRRGYAGFVSCRFCGYVCKCPHCSVSLSEHRKMRGGSAKYQEDGLLVCHYCGYTQPLPQVCPQCGSRYILGFRAGTQQIAEQIGRLFPGARVLRMDADTTRTKDSYEKILSAFANREADVLVGTQMIVKGHDFPNVTLVGILAADLSLSLGDYRAAERTFQLLTQAAGRAGRGERPGEVVIQTYQPEHYSIRYAAAQDYEGFFEEEMTYRRLLSYPPASHILAVQLSSEKEQEAMEAAGDVARIARELAAQETPTGPLPQTVVIGPAPALIEKINDVYRYGVYIKNKDYRKLVAVKNAVEKERAGQERPKANCQFDFDPVSAY